MLIRNPWVGLRELTAARIALGRAGSSLPTSELLDFQLAHAKARDAVWHPMDVQVFARFAQLCVRSMARDRATYLRRPDLGRRLHPEDRAAVVSAGPRDVVFVVADGLSALAVERHAPPLLDALHVEQVVVVEQGRVAIGDELGELMGAELSVVLIGERPGLGSPDSLGAYLTWNPKLGRTDAERECVSNIRTEGLRPDLAAMKIAEIIRESRRLGRTGVGISR